MREIAILSGKGGTGKTSFVASFAALAKKKVVLADCDVDAANLALLMPGKDLGQEPFFAGARALIDEYECTGCGECVEVCRFDAVHLHGGTIAQVDSLSCEGCRACSQVCPEEAIRFADNRSGTLYSRETKHGPLVHAALGIAQDNSGKLVTRVREHARSLAEERGIDTILIDGPPGIGCPVHASLTGVNFVVAVTEPTPSGLHDVDRLVELCRHFKIRVFIIVNKFDLNENLTTQLAAAAQQNDAQVIGGVPFHKDVPRALARSESPLAVPIVGEALARIWRYIEENCKATRTGEPE